MTGGGYDYAICGTTPFATLLAGVLASAHGKRVCMIGDPWSPYRLPRRLDLSVSVATRPETWALLKRESADVLKLLNSIRRGLFERVDPIFVAETPASIDRLGHMRWTAAAHGFAAERAVDPAVTTGGAICRIRDAAILVGGRAEPALEAWLDKLGVARLPATSTGVTARRDGTATISSDGRDLETAVVVLADDAAILTHQAAGDRHRLLTAVPAAAVVTEPAAKALPASFCAYLDRDLVLHQRSAKTPVSAFARGDTESVLARIGASAASAGTLRRVGQAVYRSIETADGAPLVGRTGRNKVTIIAGLGDSAAFVAPAVARWLAGAAAADDRAWFEARDVARAAHRQSVAETAARTGADA